MPLSAVQELIKKMNARTPFRFEVVEGDGSLHLEYRDVTVNIFCYMRMYDEEKLFWGDDDVGFEEIKNILRNEIITKFDIRICGKFVTDPIFLFENGFTLEIISTNITETWTIDIEDDLDIRNIYIGNDLVDQ